MQNYEPDVSQLLGLYQQLEDDIVADMVRRMLRMGFVSESTAYQAEVLQTAGILYDDILQMIADRTDASVAQVRAMFEDAGVRTVEIDNDTHEAAGEAPADIRQDGGMKQVLETGYRKTLGTMRNLVGTTANTTQTAFLHACDRAYMQVSSGAFSYQEAIRMAVRNLADGGAYVTYPTGHRDRIDVAVRRCILTGVGQTAAAVAKKRAEDSGCQYMELTAHGGARPEHARWQGQLVQIQGKRTRKVIDGLKVFTLEEIGYGDGRGFKGWNCRHNWHPYYPGLSTPNYTPEEIAKLDEKSISYNGEKYTEYEISQMQRKGERKVRELKRRAAALDEAVKNTDDPVLKQGLNDDFAAASVRLKDAEKTLKDFCRQTGRRNDTFRSQVNGFGRSTAQRAVHQNNLAFQESMRKKGFQNPPKSLAKMEKMQYNDPKEYALMKSYEKSVDTGMMSPLVGYEKYKEYHQRVETELVGLKTNGGVVIRSQSKHFLERVFGTISDPSHSGVKREGVELEDVKEALEHGKVKKHPSRDSMTFATDKCIVSVNTKTGNLIQVTPQ